MTNVLRASTGRFVAFLICVIGTLGSIAWAIHLAGELLDGAPTLDEGDLLRIYLGCFIFMSVCGVILSIALCSRWLDARVNKYVGFSPVRTIRFCLFLLMLTLTFGALWATVMTLVGFYQAEPSDSLSWWPMMLGFWGIVGGSILTTITYSLWKADRDAARDARGEIKPYAGGSLSEAARARTPEVDR